MSFENKTLDSFTSISEDVSSSSCDERGSAGNVSTTGDQTQKMFMPMRRLRHSISSGPDSCIDNQSSERNVLRTKRMYNEMTEGSLAHTLSSSTNAAFTKEPLPPIQPSSTDECDTDHQYFAGVATTTNNLLQDISAERMEWLDVNFGFVEKLFSMAMICQGQGQDFTYKVAGDSTIKKYPILLNIPFDDLDEIFKTMAPESATDLERRHRLRILVANHERFRFYDASIPNAG